ncbi:MAG: hypothetical protein LUG26_00275 [Ruminococcus sp.]|nr:hypothetical protein [Ruminococcus sp.]
MESTEKREKRLEMVDMHNFFLERIERAMKEQRYIEASWLIYSCLENRYFRTILKFKKDCKYHTGKCNKKTNQLAISSKIGCLERLAQANVPYIFESFRIELFAETRKWVKDRNKLMHNLLSLETYESADTEFQKLSEDGYRILKEIYDSCTQFREKFYKNGYKFNFPEEAMEKCSCNSEPKNKKED